jgi:hypothetical protein
MPSQIVNQFTQAKDKNIPLIIFLSCTLVKPFDVMHVKR